MLMNELEWDEILSLNNFNVGDCKDTVLKDGSAIRIYVANINPLYFVFMICEKNIMDENLRLDKSIDRRLYNLLPLSLSKNIKKIKGRHFQIIWPNNFLDDPKELCRKDFSLFDNGIPGEPNGNFTYVNITAQEYIYALDDHTYIIPGEQLCFQVKLKRKKNTQSTKAIVECKKKVDKN